MDFTKEYGLKQGYLQKKKVRLKPVPRGGKMITDPSHKGYFMWEGASKQYCLVTNKHNELVSPFKDEEEMRFFSGMLDQDLNVHKRVDNFWHKFYVKIIKDHKLMAEGEEFDLSDPMDNIRHRVLKMQAEIAGTWEDRFARLTYKFAFVDEDYEEVISNQEMDMKEAIWTFWGEIKNSPKKMREFLGIYWMEKKVLKSVSPDSSKEFLTTEIKKIMDSDPEMVHTITKDKDSETKHFIFQAMQNGAILRKGIVTYEIVGENKEYDYTELIGHIKFLKENTDPLYLKMEAQINSKK